MPLNRFKIAKKEEIAELQDLANIGNFPEPFQGERVNFLGTLKNNFTKNFTNNSTNNSTNKSSNSPLLPIIAEYKKASPSRGIICERLKVEEVAKEYVNNGADALSILTEETYFQGKLSYIDRAHSASHLVKHTPLLRKDFIFDPLQIYATASTKASALLLIVRLTPNAQDLRFLREEAEKFGMHAIVEIFNEEELVIARESGANIIQVNARDLQTFRVNTEACLNLAKQFKPQSHELWIAASGIENTTQILDAKEAGYHAVLVGSALMEHGTPGASLAKLIGKT